jgi:hypothetical protein
MIRRNLQKLGGIAQAMHLIEDDPLTLEAFQKAFRLIHLPPLPRQLAVEIFDILQRTANRCFPRPSYAAKPDYRAALPQTLQSLCPKGA